MAGQGLQVGVQVQGLAQCQRLLTELPDFMFAGVKKEVGKSLLKIQADVQDRIANGANNTLHTRTGQLRRSWHITLKGDSFATFDSQFWSDSPYAHIHDAGGVIRAKRAYRSLPGGPYLNIPLAANKTPAGVTRMQAREVFAQGGHIRRSAAGKFFVFLGAKPMFVLYDQVYIRPRLGLVPILEREVADLWTRLNNLPLPTP